MLHLGAVYNLTTRLVCGGPSWAQSIQQTCIIMLYELIINQEIMYTLSGLVRLLCFLCTLFNYACDIYLVNHSNITWWRFSCVCVAEWFILLIFVPPPFPRLDVLCSQYGLGNVDRPFMSLVSTSSQNNLETTLWIPEFVEMFDMDLWTWFQLLAKMMKLFTRPIVLPW